MPCILNAANEIAVEAFLNDKIKFLQIAELVENTIAKSTFKTNLSYEQYVDADKAARELARELVTKL
jgi:1-deoxy-D-xylulose-5-phosphate reductoisomerase